jgi:uncharacterized SAM-binding protein YcdF (DUF218 family)
MDKSKEARIGHRGNPFDRHPHVLSIWPFFGIQACKPFCLRSHPFMIILKKLMLFTHPFGLAWGLLALWLAWQFWKKRGRQVMVPAFAWLLLSVFSCTPMTSWLLAGLEGRYERVMLEDASAADLIVCLGGGAEPNFMEPTGVNFNSSADRLTTALALLSMQKAPTLIVTGGGYQKAGKMYSEADAAEGYLREKLRLNGDIRSLGVCADTHDESLKIAALMKQHGWQRLLLVTSATHMPRAMAAFAKSGMTAQAIPCDYQSSFYRLTDIHWLHLPDTGSMQGFTAWMHEIIGTWVYRWRGWI